MKACMPRWISLIAFALTQVVVDIKSVYHLLQQEWPIHRHLHSLVLAGRTGLLTGTAVFLAARIVKPTKFSVPKSEVGLLAAHLGELIGGLSHSVLDSFTHVDLTPSWPFSSSFPFATVRHRFVSSTFRPHHHTLMHDSFPPMHAMCRQRERLGNPHSLVTAAFFPHRPN